MPDGTKDILGLWIEQSKGAKFWLRVMNELKGRGISDILIAVVDGLKGFPEAINAVFPRTVVQTCIVQLIRHMLDFASWKDRKPVAQARDPMPEHLRSPHGWWRVMLNGIPVQHYADRAKAERYASDAEWRAEIAEREDKARSVTPR